MKIFDFDIQLFGDGEKVLGTEGEINVKTAEVNEYKDGEGLSPQMRTYYSDYLIDSTLSFAKPTPFKNLGSCFFINS